MEVPEESKDVQPVLPEGSASADAKPAAAQPSEAVTAKAAPSPVPDKAASPQAASVATPGTPKAQEPAKPAPVAASEKPATPPPAAAKSAAPLVKPAVKPEGPKPEPWDSPLVSSLKSQYGSGIREAVTYLGQKYLVVDSSLLYEILLRMRENELFDYCVDVTAVHYPKREAQFDIIYILYSFHNNERVRVKAQIKDGESVRSVASIWPTANWLEREVFDMFGIGFDGHPELKRILLPEEWKGYPLRKDYPILQQDQEWVKINLGIESGQ